jgi:hypothetical protein
MIYRETSPGVFERWNGERLANGSLLNPFDAQRLSDPELAALDLCRPASAGPVPDDMAVTATRVERVEGVVRFVQDLEPATVELPTLTARQIRLALASIDISEVDVETLLAAEEDGAMALIEWRYANGYRRDHPLVEAIAAAFSLPSAQVDALWIWASEL